MAVRNNKTKKKNLPFTVIIILCAVLLAFAFRVLLSDVNNQIVNSNIESVKELVLHDKNSIRNSIGVRWDTMEGSVTRMASRQWTSIEELLDAENFLLNNIPDADRIGLLDSEGTLYMSTGLVKKNSYYKEICEGRNGRFVVRLNTESYITESEKEALIEAIPVDYSVCGKDMKWMLCLFPVSDLESDLKIGSYNDSGFSSVIDSEGNYILNISRTHSFGEFDNLFDGLKSAVFEGYSNIEEVRAATAETTSVVYSLNGQKYLMVISGFDFADWYIISVVPMTVFSAQSNAIIARFIILLGIIAVILAVILYLVFRQKKERERVEQEKIQKESEARIKLIEGITASYNVAYFVNMAEDSFELLRMDETIIGYEEKFENFTQAKEFFFSLLYPIDRERMRNLLDYDTIRKKLADNNSFDAEYRLPVNGAMTWHTMNVTSIDENTITIGFAVDDLEITKKHLEDKRFSEYFALYEIDFDTETAKIVIDSPYYPVDRSGTAVPYKAAMMAFADTLEGEAKEFFERISDISIVKRAFANVDKYSYTYRSDNVEGKWVDLTSFVTLRHADGTPAMFTLGFSYIDSFGAAKQELQEEIAVQKQQLEKALDLAESASRAKTEFLFNMSHDIRTPMNAILGYTDIGLRHFDDAGKVKESFIKIKSSGGHLLNLINDILEMSRIESGKVELTEEPVDVRMASKDIHYMSESLAAPKSIDLKIEIGDLKNPYIYADELHISEIIINLISNAVKYTPEGGRVTYNVNQISDVIAGKVMYRFEVSDNGIGMSEEFQRHLFEAFSREQTSTVSKIEGTGLGLSIVKKIVDMTGGTIRVRSKQKVGSTFTVEIPFRVMDDAAIEKFRAANIMDDAAAEGISFDGKKVLLVEDNEMNREIATEILEESGLVVDTAEDGEAAVRAVLDNGMNYYDFILMDIQMPVMNGYEATRAIRALHNGSGIPIIALSANAFEEDKQRSLDEGMNAHIAKPINIKELFATLAKFNYKTVSNA